MRHRQAGLLGKVARRLSSSVCVHECCPSPILGNCLVSSLIRRELVPILAPGTAYPSPPYVALHRRQDKGKDTAEHGGRCLPHSTRPVRRLYSSQPMPLHPRALPGGFIPPCLPISAKQPPIGREWLIEIKHDGFRIIARKVGKRVKLYSRPGNDLTYRFPLIVEAMAKLRSRSCIIDGEAVACRDNGMASFDRIRYRRHDDEVFLYAFDLIELNGDDLRRDKLAVRKATLERLLARAASGPSLQRASRQGGWPARLPTRLQSWA
jgi:ATP dependent DNA ligase domain